MEVTPAAAQQSPGSTGTTAEGKDRNSADASTELPKAQGGQSQSAEEGQSSGQEHGTTPWIKYRINYRDLETKELIRQHESTDPEGLKAYEDVLSEGRYPVFESIKTIHVQALDDGDKKGQKKSKAPLIATNTAPTYSIKIYSPAVINAIQSVVQYYPSQSLTGEAVSIPWPYPILCHHYDELTEFAKSCSEKELAQLCEREKDAPTHVRMLLDFLDANVMTQVREEQERNQRGKFTYEWFWVPFRPGRTVMRTFRHGAEWQPHVIHSVSGGIFRNPPDEWETKFWNMDFDGTYLGRKTTIASQLVFDGESPFEPLIVFVDGINEGDLDKQNDEVKEMVRQGGMYWDALKKQSQWYQGETASYPHNKLDALVVVDPQAHLQENRHDKPSLMSYDDCRGWSSDCVCSVCLIKDKRSDKAWRSLFEGYNSITRQSHKKGLSWHQKLLCPKTVPGFVFRTRAWEKLHVVHLNAPQFDAKMIEYLVMEQVQLQRLKALALAYARTDKQGNKIEQPAWSADFVQGKGSGLIFLLHGKPGVGKTCTAECIAEFTRSPLMVLTTSDIGTDPKTVEINLTREFKKAKSWGAVLLIDEADVFMERRSTRDLQRNSLVAGFLRALEFYDGILFLTTNRVGAFDDAFTSRIHVQLYYKDFTDEQRQKIWQNFVDKLQRERGRTMRLNIEAKEYLRGSELRAVKWNGREIRNAFQTAISLAEYDAEKDEEGKILVTDNHLRAVVELSRDFKNYMKELHKADEAKRAASRHERMDDYETIYD